MVREELNVKALEFAGEATDLVAYQVKPNYRTLGPRFGKAMPEAAAVVAALPGDVVVRRLEAREPVTVEVAGEKHDLGADDLLVDVRRREGFAIEREGDLMVGLSTVLTPELESEGLARELVHHVQNTRKAAGFRVEDRIALSVRGPQAIAGMIEEHAESIKKETLSVVLKTDGEIEGYREELSINGLPVVLTMSRIEG
ncbi:MAG: DUF5915 domain-containing protein [Thermoleophilia bacterium]|nr:DUF5915 domain-containing protein [Thermoleophilia bacterium]